jgi:hypothetical protein
MLDYSHSASTSSRPGRAPNARIVRAQFHKRAENPRDAKRTNPDVKRDGYGLKKD